LYSKIHTDASAIRTLIASGRNTSGIGSFERNFYPAVCRLSVLPCRHVRRTAEPSQVADRDIVSLAISGAVMALIAYIWTHL
jgi:hypothetical protein